jgi:hypothetical protein
VYVADFLAAAIEHFKRHRDELKTELYKDGPYRGEARRRGCPLLCYLRVAHPGDKDGHYLTPAQWFKAVGWAYSSANTLEQMANDIVGFRANAHTDPTGWVADIIETLVQPYGHLKALRKMFCHAERWDAEEGEKGGER